MPVISSYALQLKNVVFSAIAESTFDLFITEGAPLAPGGGFPELSKGEVTQLVAQGRTVVGYVNVAVTDDARYYWNPTWTDNGQDTGNPVPGQAPSWLDQAVPIDFDHDGDQDALIVEYWDLAWQQIVIDQAVELVENGYSGVFLDDVGRYYDAGIGSGTVALMADRMIDFIHRIRLAVAEVNPNAVIITNTNPYIVTDSSGGTSGSRAATHRADVDVHLIENQGIAAYDQFALHLTGAPLLVLQSVPNPPLTYEQAWARGILYTAPNEGYGALGTFAYPATSGADTLSGGDGPNRIDGLGGNDVLYGGNGNDVLDGGADNDTLFGNAGADQLGGGTGNDIYYVDDPTGLAFEAVGAGNDIVYVGASYTLLGGQEIETLSSNNHAATSALALTGNSFNQVVVGNAGNNILHGGGGTDQLYGFGGNDVYYTDVAATQVLETAGGGTDALYTSVSYVLAGGQEVETLSVNNYGATGAINLTGNNFNQILAGNNGANILHGGGGTDTLYGMGGNDIFITDVAATQVFENAGGGTDTLYTSVSYALAAGSEVEILSTNDHGGSAAINLTGNAINNTLAGNAGANTLNGGAGNDTLYGFGGADNFAFTTTLGAGNTDYLADFAAVDDTIQLDDAIFSGIGTPGAFSAGAFVVGAATADANDRIVYNQATGQLFYDADGNGAGAQVLFATLAGAPILTAGDFAVI